MRALESLLRERKELALCEKPGRRRRRRLDMDRVRRRLEMILSWSVGSRDADSARVLMRDLAARAWRTASN
jgi:hypothetical protein